MRGSSQPDLHWTWPLNKVIRIVVCCQQSESRISLWDWREVRRKKPSLFDYDRERSPWVEFSPSNDNWPQKFPSGEEPGEYWWRRGWKDTSHLWLEGITHTHTQTYTDTSTHIHIHKQRGERQSEWLKELKKVKMRLMWRKGTNTNCWDLFHDLPITNQFAFRRKDFDAKVFLLGNLVLTRSVLGL